MHLQMNLCMYVSISINIACVNTDLIFSNIFVRDGTVQEMMFAFTMIFGRSLIIPKSESVLDPFRVKIISSAQ